MYPVYALIDRRGVAIIRMIIAIAIRVRITLLTSSEYKNTNIVCSI